MGDVDKTKERSVRYTQSHEIQGQSKNIPNICNSAPVSRHRTLATVVLCSVDFKLYFDTSNITPLSMSHELRGLE